MTPDKKEKKRAAARKWYAKNRERVRAQQRAHYVKDPAKRKDAVKKWQIANPEKVRKQGREWAKLNPEKHRKSCRESNWRRHGLPVPTRPRPELCECCGERPDKRVLALDHDHVTGGFRGWLCWKCNAAIGKLGDNSQGLRRALHYLERVES